MTTLEKTIFRRRVEEWRKVVHRSQLEPLYATITSAKCTKIQASVIKHLMEGFVPVVPSQHQSDFVFTVEIEYYHGDSTARIEKSAEFITDGEYYKNVCGNTEPGFATDDWGIVMNAIGTFLKDQIDS